MRIKNFIFLPLLLVNCAAGPGPDFAVGGIDVYVDKKLSLNYRDVERVIRQTVKAYGKPKLLTEGSGRLYLESKKLKCTQASVGWCYGLTYTDIMQVYVNDEECLGRTAIAHEMLHWLLGQDKKGMDPKHSNPVIWKTSGGNDSLEATVNQKINLSLGCW